MDFQKVLHLENGEWGAHKRSKSDFVGRESRAAAKTNTTFKIFLCTHPIGYPANRKTPPTCRKNALVVVSKAS